jgi:hypothetical protein
VHGEIFNVGETSQNYRVREVAELVAEAIPGCGVTFGTQGADNRSYRVSFDKIHRHLPGFSCQWDAGRGARQLADLFGRIGLGAEDFNARGFTRLKQLEHLIATGQLDQDFFWTVCP